MWARATTALAHSQGQHERSTSESTPLGDAVNASGIGRAAGPLIANDQQH